MLLDFISLAQQSQTHRSYSVNTYWMNEWPREIYAYFCLDNSLLPTRIPLLMSQCVGPPREKIIWALYAKGLSLPELSYTFNIPVALFSKTGLNSLGQEEHIQKPVNALRNSGAFFFSHSASIDHLPNMCWALSNPVVTRTICPWGPHKASRKKIIVMANVYWVLSISTQLNL